MGSWFTHISMQKLKIVLENLRDASLSITTLRPLLAQTSEEDQVVDNLLQYALNNKLATCTDGHVYALTEKGRKFLGKRPLFGGQNAAPPRIRRERGKAVEVEHDFKKIRIPTRGSEKWAERHLQRMAQQLVGTLFITVTYRNLFHGGVEVQCACGGVTGLWCKTLAEAVATLMVRLPTDQDLIKRELVQ